MLWLILFVLAVAIGLRLYIYGNDDYWPNKKIPFVKGSDIGSFWDRLLIRIPFHEVTQIPYNKLKAMGKHVKFGGIMEFRRPVAFIVNLDLIKNITVKDFDHFINRRPFGPKEDPTLMGRILFNMENQEWKDTRSAMSPTFTTGKIRKMFEIFNKSSNRMVQFLKKEIAGSKELDVRDACSRFTMDVVASTAFGVQSQVFVNKNSIFSEMGKRVQKQFQGLKVFKLFISILLPGLMKFLRLKIMDEQAFKFFSEVTKKTIEHRRKTGERREDFLKLLIDARDGQLIDEGDERGDDNKLEQDIQSKSQKVSAVEWTDELILAQGLLFFVAGFDTTETLLIYALYELALNPDVQERLATEIENTQKTKDGLSYDEINQNEYLDMVISETLRKYPPAARTERKCTREYQVPGTPHIIPYDQICIIPIYGIHHDPEYYPEPDKFIPERFNAENKKNRNPYTYMPFGVGPRNCIAMRFAIVEGKCAVAHLVHNFKIEACSKTQIPVQFDTSGAMKPKHGMWLKLSPRK